jgi:pimeloyl-ACP methyl ester carboxylesterase
MNERKTRIEAVIADRSASLSIREWRVPKPRGQVICLHGFGVTGAEYGPLADRLNRLRYDVLLPDWIGHGDSEFLGDPAAYSWDSYAKCLGAVMRHYHASRTHYVGTSWGGALLLLFLMARPVLPQSAVFVDVPVKSSPELARHQTVFEEQAKMSFATLEEANQFLQQQRPHFAQVPARFKSYLDAERIAQKDGRFFFKFDPAILPAYAASVNTQYSRIKNLTRLNFNALFLYGQASPHRSTPDFMAICARMPNIRYRDNLPGGHPPMLLHEEQYEPIVDYIKQVS